MTGRVLLFCCRKALLGLVSLKKNLDLFSAITPVRQGERSQGYDKWALMSAEAPHGVTFSCPRAPTVPPPRTPQVRPSIENPQPAQCAGGHAVLSNFPESAWIMRLTHVATAQSWQAFSGQDTPSSDLLKGVSHLNIRDSLITPHFLPVLQFRQSTEYCDQITVCSWYQACDALYVTSSAIQIYVVCFYFGYSIWRPVLSCQQHMSETISYQCDFGFNEMYYTT